MHDSMTSKNNIINPSEEFIFTFRFWTSDKIIHLTQQQLDKIPYLADLVTNACADMLPIENKIGEYVLNSLIDYKQFIIILRSISSDQPYILFNDLSEHENILELLHLYDYSYENIQVEYHQSNLSGKHDTAARFLITLSKIQYNLNDHQTVRDIFISIMISNKPIEDSRLGLNEVVYQPEKSKIYLGSPSIVRLSSGRLLASHDFFGVGYNASVKNVSVFSSDDNGQTWSFLSYIKPSFFTSLTVYENRVYAIGIDGKHQSGIIIHRSIDEGLTWNYNNVSSGVVLFKGAFSTGATGIVLANNIIYRSIEYRTVPGHWPEEFQAAIISCNLTLLSTDNVLEDDPLMNPKNWRITPPLVFNRTWIPSSYPNLTAPGYLEGSVAILSPATNSSDIRVFNVMRFNSIPLANLAILLELNLTTNILSFISIIHFPGGMSKFTIRYDLITQTYLTLSNPVTSQFDYNQRNVLSLCYSKDLINWNIGFDQLLYDDTGLQANDSLHYTGFHYVDWQFDDLSSSKTNSTCIEWNCNGGPDLIYLIRTSYRGAESFHNSNRITFKTLPNFRQFIK